jgi:hypothetical protein
MAAVFERSMELGRHSNFTHYNSAFNNIANTS